MGWSVGKGGAVLCKHLCSCNPLFSHKKFVYCDFAQDHDSFSPITGLEWPRGFQEVKVPRLHDSSTGSEGR